MERKLKIEYKIIIRASETCGAKLFIANRLKNILFSMISQKSTLSSIISLLSSWININSLFFNSITTLKVGGLAYSGKLYACDLYLIQVDSCDLHQPYCEL
ncbi:hypothetical protein L1987_75701 [Smallanthus sonchifolius]|uniref:Uncharacterized protein n=1 Tax=Smallanthus sonchifolius TaxID=185202 RepID=A0ACB9A6G5_9ASTR|nr:hypothetical protein L1987_75701 [Smallanthus sonchifolius]